MKDRTLGGASGLALAALGIVYGDIGTSPLYALKAAVQAAGGAGSAATVLGVVSLLLWSLILIVSVKYAVLIMQADNQGEGGVVAMLALLNARDAKPGTAGALLLVLGLVGAALLYGDGAITPAISVLSAVEGLKVPAPHLGPLVIPITVAVLIGLFSVQWRGTGFIGGIFGPVMLAWFLLLAILGLRGIVTEPRVLEALSPTYALHFLLSAPPLVSFAVLGAVFLAVTGGEAMYADMGHFGRFPIRLAWFVVALPALGLDYFGQGALLIRSPAALANPFFLLAPGWAHIPLVLFATMATVIASQAIISGVYSLTQQAVQLGFLPQLQIVHTDKAERGQVYVPLANWLLAAGTLGAVLAFRTSDALAGAYGIAVSALMAISTFLAALIALKWRINPVLVIATNGFFLAVDLLFFSANALKLLDGGWYPLSIAAIVAFLMLTWRRGALQTEAARVRLRRAEAEFLHEVRSSDPYRIPGVAAFLAASSTGMPLSLTQHFQHNRVLHKRVVLVTVIGTEEPLVAPEERADVSQLSHGLERVVLRFGFMERLDIPQRLREVMVQAKLSDDDLDRMTYYIGRETILPTAEVAGMSVWRETVFAAMQRNAERSASHFGIPTRQAVEVGLEIEI